MVCFLFVVFRYADKDKYKIEVRKNEKAPNPAGIGAFFVMESLAEMNP